MRQGNKVRSSVAVTSAVVFAFALSSLSPANAGEASKADRGLGIAEEVAAAEDPETRFESLSASERELFESVTEPVTTEIVGEEVSSSANRANSISAGCYDHWQRYEAKAAAGNTVYTWWQGLRWCHNGTRVTSWNVYDRGGETRTPGWSYSGRNGQGSRNVGWEIRSYTKEKFSFGVGDFGYSTSECGQIRGGNGRYSVQASCGLS